MGDDDDDEGGLLSARRGLPPIVPGVRQMAG